MKYLHRHTFSETVAEKRRYEDPSALSTSTQNSGGNRFCRSRFGLWSRTSTEQVALHSCTGDLRAGALLQGGERQLHSLGHIPLQRIDLD